jgi:hypothetical protein
MTRSFNLFRRIAHLRAPVFAALILALTGCKDDAFEPDSSAPADATDTLVADEESVEAVPVDDAAALTRRGIPIGHFAQPISTFGRLYNGGHQNFSPNTIVKELAAIRARGGRVVIPFAGSPRYYKENGHFSLTKWKARVNRFRRSNISTFVSDGTIIGHYMIDEPNDPANWGGRPVPPSVLEEMARYSKQLWPRMTTVVRVEPGYLTRSHRYLDAAWAQYLSRKGTPDGFIRRNVAAAQERRLGLIVGLNVMKGGTPNGTKMTAGQVKSWGSTLLNSTYPCAFISWTYNRTYLSSRGMSDAMGALRRKAEGRSNRSCRSA